MLRLKDCAETKILKGVYRTLKNDPILKSVIKHWNFWDGSSIEQNVNQLPSIGVYPGDDGESEQVAYTLAQSSFPLDIVIIVEGTDASDLLNLWHAVRLSLNDDAIKSLIKTSADNDHCFVNSSAVSKPAYSNGKIDETNVMTAEGRLEVEIQVRTIRR